MLQRNGHKIRKNNELLLILLRPPLQKYTRIDLRPQESSNSDRQSRRKAWRPHDRYDGNDLKISN